MKTKLLHSWVTLLLVLPIIILSCKKNILPENETASSILNDDMRTHDMLSNKIIIEWSDIAWQAAGGATEGHPLLASRIEAMMHIAIHDALNAIVPVYERYVYQPEQEYILANPFAASASAAHTVLKASWPDSAAMLDAKLAESLSGIPDGIAKTKGIELGIESGNAILALRANDGAYQYPLTDIPFSNVPGVYTAVPPNDSMYGVFWKDMQLFSLKTQDQFRSSLPPALKSLHYAHDFNEIKLFGKLNSSVRTADQSAYANFWYELMDIAWNRIARTQATDHNTGLYTTARMFALLNMAIADTYTACWNAKYYYYRWRPYTAIRNAGTDGNNLTLADPNWETFLPTPPIPEYPSGHASLANAAATVLVDFYGDNTPFSTISTTASSEGEVRSYKSFKQAADEIAISRVMAGIHFRYACDAGQKMGNEVGKWTLENHLKRLN